MAFRFNMRRTEKDPTGYYYTRWDKATPVSVIADSEPEAFEKLWALSGTASRDRVWTAKIDSIEEIPAETASAPVEACHATKRDDEGYPWVCALTAGHPMNDHKWVRDV